MKKTTIVKNGKEIPYREWKRKEEKRLRIKRSLAQTAEEKIAAAREEQRHKHFCEFVDGTSGSRKRAEADVSGVEYS